MNTRKEVTMAHCSVFKVVETDLLRLRAVQIYMQSLWVTLIHSSEDVAVAIHHVPLGACMFILEHVIVDRTM